MNEALDGSLNLTWKAFLLEQVNHPKSRDESWYAWEDPDFESRDLLPHEAAKSVLHHEGRASFDRYHRALFRGHHEEDRDLTSMDTLVEIAGEQDLDSETLRRDLNEQRFRKAVGEDHREGEEQYGMFGVPTILFEGSQPIFLKLDEGDWEGTEDVELFRYVARAAERPYLLTLKKPGKAADMPAVSVEEKLGDR